MATLILLIVLLGLEAWGVVFLIEQIANPFAPDRWPWQRRH